MKPKDEWGPADELAHAIRRAVGAIVAVALVIAAVLAGLWAWSLIFP